jgi:hypothetical protein
MADFITLTGRLSSASIECHSTLVACCRDCKTANFQADQISGELTYMFDVGTPEPFSSDTG